MKILITGVAGTGKSTISKELQKRGINSIDFSDIPDLCSWRDKITKQEVKYSLPVEDGKWFDSNERICNLNKLKDILDKYEDIIITGIASGNQTEYLKFFDKVLLLQCSPETFINRMKSRIPIFGKTDAERNFVVDWQKELDPILLSYGAVPINTEGTIDSVMGKIIIEISQNIK